VEAVDCNQDKLKSNLAYYNTLITSLHLTSDLTI
jgi:hypothetical protein